MHSLAFALFSLKSKEIVRYVHPTVLIALRQLFGLPFILAYVLLTGFLVPIALPTAGLLFVTAVLVTLGFILLFKAYEVSDLSKVAAVSALDPLVILMYSYIVFTTLPSGLQLIGGAVMLVGTFVLIFSRKMPKLPIIAGE